MTIFPIGEGRGATLRRRHVAWLGKLLVDAKVVEAGESEARAKAIYAAVAGAQLFARGRSDIALFDKMIASYRAVGLLPA